MNNAPIALFTYARLAHTRLTVEALLRNYSAENHDLIIFSDAARTPEQQYAVNQVRSFLETITGFRSVTIHHRAHNFGLAKSIIEGVTQVLTTYDRIIVLEDDLVTSPHFLTYMNQSLDRFVNDERVISIHGYVYPVEQVLPEAFFLRGADCWGWATWRRGWRLFNPDGQMLLDQLTQKKLLNDFDFNGTHSYSKMLKEQIAGANDSWAIRWHASAFLEEKLTLYPGRSLVNNTGNDGSGTHCGSASLYDVGLSSSPIDISMVDVSPSVIGATAFESFFRKSKLTFLKKLSARIKQLLPKAIV